MPHGWISRLKKSHDLEVCTRPTCRGILRYGIRKKKFPAGSDTLINIVFFGKNISAVCKFEKKILPIGKYFLANTIA